MSNKGQDRDENKTNNGQKLVRGQQVPDCAKINSIARPRSTKGRTESSQRQRSRQNQE